MRRRLHVVLTVDPYLPVPPRLYGGIERIVDFLACGLVSRGHRVTLIAHPDSRTPAELVSYGVPPHSGHWARLREVAQVGARLLRRAGSADVVHSFGRLAALVPILPMRWIAKVQSYQRDVVPWRSVRIAERLAGRSICFTGCSASVYTRPEGRGPFGGEWHTIFNGVETGRYRFVREVPDDAPLAFLGRLEPQKGAHDAIAIARAAGRRLLIAGNQVSTGAAARYFDEAIRPHIDGDRVTYLGPVDDEQKNDLLGRCAALLMPIGWAEPFGIVMTEALACGTPVIGYPRGSVPEVIRSGVNGFLCDDIEEAARLVQRLPEIDRAAVRRDCESRFGNEVIVSAYENLYFDLLARRDVRLPLPARGSSSLHTLKG